MITLIQNKKYVSEKILFQSYFYRRSFESSMTNDMNDLGEKFYALLNKENISIFYLYIKEHNLYGYSDKIPKYKKIWKANIPNFLKKSDSLSDEYLLHENSSEIIYATWVKIPKEKQIVKEMITDFHMNFNSSLLLISKDFDVNKCDLNTVYQIVSQKSIGVIFDEQQVQNLTYAMKNQKVIFVSTSGFFDDRDLEITFSCNEKNYT